MSVNLSVQRPVSILSIVLTGLCLLCGWSTALAAPTTAQVHGVLQTSSGGPASDGKYPMTFSIYAGSQAKKADWSEGPVDIAVFGGHFSHTLGTKIPLPASLGQLASPWLGVQVGQDPELPRRSLHAVLYAMRAQVADALSCSGCVSAKQLATASVSAAKVNFTFAGAKTKGGPATLATDLKCSGCVGVSELVFDADLDLGKHGIKTGKVVAATLVAGSVSANSYVGDGSKLTGIALPSGACKNKGEVVNGIKADGSLSCTKAMDPSAFPPDAIDEISNDLIHNQFVDEIASATTPTPIPDNNPVGIEDSLVFPDIGIAQKFEVKLHLTNSDLSSVVVELYDPAGAKYVLYAKSAKGQVLKTSYPNPTKQVSGNLGAWVGNNPKGKWRLRVIDTKYLNNKMDGQIEAWSISIQTLSNKKVMLKGDLLLKGGLRLGAYPNACNAANAGVLRWTGKHFEACNGKRFMVIRLFVGPGSSDNPVGANCKEVADASPGGKSGLYWLKPGKGAAFQVWCDLSSHDGGWSLALNLDTNNNLSHHYFDTTFWTTSKTEGELSAARVSDHKSRVFSEMPVTEIMIEAHIEGTKVGTATYALTAAYKGKTLQNLLSTVKNATVTGNRLQSTGVVGNNGHTRNAGDSFIDHKHALIFNSTFSPGPGNSTFTRIATNYTSLCGTINCNGHTFSGLGGRHYRGGWGAYYEAAQVNGYCNSQGVYGSNHSKYNGNNAASGCTYKSRDMDFSIWVR